MPRIITKPCRVMTTESSTLRCVDTTLEPFTCQAEALGLAYCLPSELDA